MNALTASAPTDAERIAKMIAGMAEVLGVKATPERLRGYVAALADVPVELVAAGVRRAITGWRYPDMPKPADIRAAVDAEQRTRVVPEDEREVPYQAGYVCTRCDDSGWVFVAERTDRAQPTVKRCSCYQTNPRLVQPKTYSQSEDRR
jgi:hypothetical protein